MKVLIIGGGVIGLSCAWRLADAGAQVELFDGRGCGLGATHASLGALWPASPLAMGPLQELHRASLWDFEAFVKELTEKTGVPILFRRLGRIELLNSEKAEARAREEAEAADNFWPDFAAPAPTMQVLAPEEIHDEQPELASTGHAGLFCRATAQVHIPQLVMALRAACVKAGVKIHERTPVLSLEDADGKVAVVRIPAGYVAADCFLVAAGAWTPLISPLVAHCGGTVGAAGGAHPDVAGVTVRPAKGQGIALRPPPGLRLGQIVKSGTVYLIPWHFDGHLPPAESLAFSTEGQEVGDEILVGSTTEPEAGYDETPTDAALHALLTAAYTLLPPLREAQVLRQWAGLRPQNPRKPHPPIMGRHPRVKNLYLCTGHYKTGVGLAPRVSELMTACIMSNETPAELAPFVPAHCA